jgi:hypothetical protein
MAVLDLLLGRSLASDEARGECVGPAAGIPIFGLDALSSAAYGPEAALTLLIPLGAAGIAYIVPISASIIVLLAIVYFSYRQTIQAYPGGGGSYTVARQNLGVSAGLLAAAALIWNDLSTRNSVLSFFFHSCSSQEAAQVAAGEAITTIDHSDIRGSEPHNRDPSGAASD